MSYNPFDDFEEKPSGGAGFSLNVVEVIPTKDEKDLKIELLEKHIKELYETLMIPHYENVIIMKLNNKLNSMINQIKIKNDEIKVYKDLHEDSIARFELLKLFVNNTLTYYILESYLDKKIINQYAKKSYTNSSNWENNIILILTNNCENIMHTSFGSVSYHNINKYIKSYNIVRRAGASLDPIKYEYIPISWANKECFIKNKDELYLLFEDSIKYYAEKVISLNAELKILEEEFPEFERKTKEEIKFYQDKIDKISQGRLFEM